MLSKTALLVPPSGPIYRADLRAFICTERIKDAGNVSQYTFSTVYRKKNMSLTTTTTTTTGTVSLRHDINRAQNLT